MNVQDACDAIAVFLQSDVLSVLGGEQPPVTDPLPQAGSDAFLSDNVGDLIDRLADVELTEHDLVGILESNAFLAALQRAHEIQYRSRIQRWADCYSQKNRVSSSTGALLLQLKGIGVKVDDEFVTKAVTRQEA